MKARLKGDNEWKDYLPYCEDGKCVGLVIGEIEVKRELGGFPKSEQPVTVKEYQYMPFDKFDLWEEPNWQEIRTKAAIAAMQGMLSDRNTILDIQKNFKASTAIAKEAVLYADKLIEELKKQ